MPSSLELGMQALEEGSPSRAASFFEFALKRAPADPALRMLAADAYIQADMFGRAEPHVRVLLEQADTLYQRGEYEMLARARSAMSRIDSALGRASEGAIALDAGVALDLTDVVPPEAPPELEVGLRPRVMACPWCGKTVLLDAAYSGRCPCGWFQPARGSVLHLADLQRICLDRRAILLMRIYQDLFALDGTDVRLRLMSKKALKVDPRLAFELDLGHAVVRPEQMRPAAPELHPTAVFRMLESGPHPETAGTDAAGEGQFYSFAEMVDRIEVEYSDAFALLPRDIHYQAQLARHLAPDLRLKADEQLAAGARSYGRCLLTAGMTMEDLLRMVPGWQILRPIGSGHGRLEAVRALVRRGFVSEMDAAAAIAKGRGRDALDLLVESKLIGREAADEAAVELAKRPLQPPLRDDFMERLCRRGIISRVTLVRAGLVLGLVDAELGGEAAALSGAMSQIPPDEIAREKELLAKKETLRRSERLPLGKILIELGSCSRQKIAEALARQIKEDAPLGEMLVRDFTISPEQLAVALVEQEHRLEQLILAKPEPVPGGPRSAPASRAAPGSERAPEPTRKRTGVIAGLDRRRLLILAGCGGAAAALGIAAAFYLGSRPAHQARDLAITWSDVTLRAPAELDDRRNSLDVPLRDADGAILPPLADPDPDGLRAELDRLRREEPTNHLRRAQLLRALGLRKAATPELEKALRRKTSPATILNVAFDRIERGKMGESLVLVEGVLKQAPNDPFARIARGAIWAAGGNDAVAAQEFAEARKLEPRLIVAPPVAWTPAPTEGGKSHPDRRPGIALAVTFAVSTTATETATETATR